MGAKLNIVRGQRFNRWTVIKEVDKKGGQRRFLCECDCGTIKEVQIGHLYRGTSKSCGCYQKEVIKRVVTKHNMSDTKIYKIYHGIKKRCYNKNTVGFKYWGGKGIKMCDEWLADFCVFESWARNNGYVEGLSIERLDNEKNYHPDNCIFIPRCEQPLNQTKRGDNTSGYTGIYIGGINNNIYRSIISCDKKQHNLGNFLDIRKAVMTRNYFIIENNLKHKLQVIK